MANVNKNAVRTLLAQYEEMSSEVDAAIDAHRAALAEISARKSALVAEMATALDGATKFQHPVSGREITVVERKDDGVTTYFLRGLNPSKPAKKSNVISLDA